MTVLWMSAVTGYLMQAIGWQRAFILEGVPSVVWGVVWSDGGARSASGGVDGWAAEARAHLEEQLEREQQDAAAGREAGGGIQAAECGAA